MKSKKNIIITVLISTFLALSTWQLFRFMARNKPQEKASSPEKYMAHDLINEVNVQEGRGEVSIEDISPMQTPNDPCYNRKKCKKALHCKCFCSRVCEYRDIEDSDSPIWHNDICYCKQWDLDHYYKRCVKKH